MKSGAAMRMPKSVDLRCGVLRKYSHVMDSVKAMLIAASTSVAEMTSDDFADRGRMSSPPPKSVAATKNNARAVIEAAALVFMHSAYENAVFDLIRQLVRYDPDHWAKRIGRKKLRFEEIRSTEVKELQTKLLDKWLKEIEGQSLPKKVAIVFDALAPKEVREIIPGFRYKQKDLENIDKLRHKVTHNPSFDNPIEDVLGKLEFLHCMVRMLEKLAERKYSPDWSND